MTIEEMNFATRGFLADCSMLAAQKNRDYHPDNVAMLEVMRTAWETGITVEQDLWARVRKQLSALRRFVIDGHVESEPPRSRMMDVVNYMGIMAFWVEHKSECLSDALLFLTLSTRCETPASCEGGTWDRHCCDRCAFREWVGGQCTASK